MYYIVFSIHEIYKKEKNLQIENIEYNRKVEVILNFRIMLKSMTGYGRANREFAGTRYIIEIKSVNNKVLNLNLRTPLSLQERENELRSELIKLLERGSVLVNIDVDHSQEKPANKINQSVVKDYYHQIQQISADLALDSGNNLGNALRMPGIFSAESNEINDEFWSTLLE